MIGRISYMISFIIPSGKVLLFFSYPNFTDNAYAMYMFILRTPKYKGYKKVWILDKNEPNYHKTREEIKMCDAATLVFSRNSIIAIWYYYRSKYFFFTHSLYSSLSVRKERNRINLWHGMPLKNIGLLQKNTYTSRTSSDIIISTSPLFQDIMSRAFGSPTDKVLITGQPRNDMFWAETDFFDKNGIQREKYKKVGVWLPTYRTSLNAGEILVEGKQCDFISFLSLDDIGKLNDFLQREEVLLIIKIHPMDLLNKKEFPTFSNILIFTNDRFNSQLYPLLGASDFLLTDYSSVWVDYEILNKPIGYVFDDLDEYEESRGFTVDNLINKLPGQIISNMEELTSFIKCPEVQRSQDVIKWNEYKDNHSSLRIIEYLDSFNG